MKPYFVSPMPFWLEPSPKSENPFFVELVGGHDLLSHCGRYGTINPGPSLPFFFHIDLTNGRGPGLYLGVPLIGAPAGPWRGLTQPFSGRFQANLDWLKNAVRAQCKYLSCSQDHFLQLRLI